MLRSLILMGQFFFLMCGFCEYHFIEKNNTWNEARNYCREHYTDLVTVYDKTNNETLWNLTKNLSDVWIGLYRIQGQKNRMWHWSLPGLEYNENRTLWQQNEPNNKGGNENCVVLRNNTWADFPCDHLKNFICYDERKTNETFHFIGNNKTWPKAQSYCRENHNDLVSGLDQLEKVKGKNKTGEFWIGLFRDTWRWSDGSSSSFRNFDQCSSNDEGSEICAVFSTDGKWGSADCNKEKPFLCYDDNMILIKENKTWDEALNYCRENHHNLVSITNLYEQRWAQRRAKNASTPYIWLGLRYTCTLEFWFWISDKVVNYGNWASGEMDDCDMSGAMDREGEHKWFKKPDTERFNFICSTL